MIKILDILKTLEKAAPPHLAESYDNVGFIVGRGDNSVTKILVALDITADVVKEAKEKGAELIVAHHPVIFRDRKRITDADVTGDIVLSLAENKIGAICMHTNLDSARLGVNDILAKTLGVAAKGVIDPKDEEDTGIGRYGEIEKECDIKEFLGKVCKALSAKGVKYHDGKKKVKRVAVGGGSCGEFVEIAHSLGCDTLVTADIKHNQFLDGAHLGLNIIDAGHFATEDIVCPRICDIIREGFPSVSVEIAEADTDATEFFTV